MILSYTIKAAYNVQSRIMLSAPYCDHISKVLITKDYYTQIIGVCYCLVNVVKNAWSLRDHIKPLT